MRAKLRSFPGALLFRPFMGPTLYKAAPPCYSPPMNAELTLQSLFPAQTKGEPLPMTVLRELTPEDMLIKEAAPPAETQKILRLRTAHHLAARLFASGLRATEVAIATGFGNSRLSILQNDPAFQELVAFYKENENARLVDLRERLYAVGLSALEEIHDRVLDDPESLSTKTLLEIAEKSFEQAQGGKRASAPGPQLSPEDLAAINQAVKGASNVRVYQETEVIEVEAEIGSGDSGAAASLDSEDTSGVLGPGAEESSRGQSQGPGL